MGRHHATKGDSGGSSLRLITIDQVISGASNFLIALLAARVLDKHAFGAFAIIFIVFTILLGVSRALVCDPLLVHPKEADEKPGEAIGASIVLGLGLTVVGVGAGVVVSRYSADLGHGLIALAACVSLLILQDLGRYLGFARKQAGRAVALDTVWLVLVIIGVAYLLKTHNHSLTWFIAVWAGTGGVTGLLTLWQYRGFPINLSVAWIRFTWPFSWRYLISYTSNQGAGLAATSSVGAIAGLTKLGAVQGTIILIRPFGTIQIAAIAAGVSSIARSALAPRAVLRRGFKISLYTTIFAAVNGAIMLALPDKIGKGLLPNTWFETKHLLLPTVAQILCLGVITGARAGLLGMRAVQRTVKVDVATTVVVLVSTVVGVAINGVSGALWAVAIGQGAMALVWWSVFRYHVSTAGDAPMVVPDDEPAAPHRAPAASAIATVVADQSSVASLGTRPVRELSPWAAWR